MAIYIYIDVCTYLLTIWIGWLLTTNCTLNSIWFEIMQIELDEIANVSQISWGKSPEAIRSGFARQKSYGLVISAGTRHTPIANHIVCIFNSLRAALWHRKICHWFCPKASKGKGPCPGHWQHLCLPSRCKNLHLKFRCVCFSFSFLFYFLLVFLL